MSDISKFMGKDIADLGKLCGVAKSNLTSFMGFGMPSTGGDRGVFGFSGTIDYVTISTPGNATDFGNLLVARANFGSTENS